MNQDQQEMTGANLSGGDDLLWQQLKTLPAFRALLRSMEARFYESIDLPRPVLDLGCGDGHFAAMVFDEPIEVGIDPWWGPLNKADRSGSYLMVVQGFGDKMPFADDFFGTVISNSVLEHIPNIQPVLNEVGRVLRPGGQLVVTMPTDLFTEKLGGAQFLDGLGLKGLAHGYRDLFNKVSRHAHTDPPAIWAQRFGEAGLIVERWQYYFSEQALHALELGHLQGIPSAICHAITGHWILAPWNSNLKFTERWVRPLYDEPFPQQGTMAFYLTRKQSGKDSSALLPPPKPLEVRAITGDQIDSYDRASDREFEGEDAIGIFENAAPEIEAAHSVSEIQKQTRKLKTPLILVSLLAIFIGTMILRQDPPNITAFSFWIAVGILAIALANVSITKRIFSSQPQATRKINARRWLILPAFIFSVIAYYLANPGSTEQRPLLAIGLWVIAIGIALVSMSEKASWRSLAFSVTKDFDSGLVIILSSIVIVGLLTRFLWINSHPFILSGSEASIGLEVEKIIRGDLKTPFATGWLTNPTFAFFLLSIPFRLIRDPILSIRILPALVGLLMVIAIYFTGRVYFGPVIGIIGATLVATSHIFIHYSRIALTNGWDPLIVTLIFGLYYSAWLRSSRALWLLAGLGVGIGAYFFTSAHLLPPFLAVLSIVTVIRWTDFNDQKTHIFAALILATIVALPQILYYLSFPATYWERWQAIGLFQTDWLIDESTLTGFPLGKIIIQQLGRGVLSFNMGVDHSNSYPSGRYLLGMLASALMILGVLLSLRRIKQLRFFILFVWLIIPLLLGGFLTLDPPNSHRLLVALPAVYLMVALAIAWLGQFILSRFTQNKKFVLVFGIGIAILIGVLDVAYYFGPFRSEHRYGDRNTEIAQGISDYVNTLNGSWNIYFYGPPGMYSSFPTFAYLIEDWQKDIVMSDVPENLEIVTPERGNNLYIFLPERQEELDLLKSQFPEGESSTFSGYHSNPLFFTYQLPDN